LRHSGPFFSRSAPSLIRKASGYFCFSAYILG
jgi:hypothetical protein